MLNFTERKELTTLMRTLRKSKHEKSFYFKLYGKSGSGKTELLKKAVENVVRSDAVYIYIDVANDEYQSSDFFNALFEIVYLPVSHKYNSVINIPDSLALINYIKRISKVHNGLERALNALTLPASMLPEIGGQISLIMDKWLQGRTTTIDNILFLYFKYIVKKTRINLIVDNYQFLPNSIKRVLETEINQFNFGFTFIVIERTNRDDTDIESFCTAFNKEYLHLDYLSYQQYELLISNQDLDIDEQKKKIIWDITQGNLKDIEIILNKVRINPGYDITNNKIAIQNLSVIQRSILLISAMFPGGMKEEYVIQFIRHILSETEEDVIQNAIVRLIDLGYIYINSHTNDTIKPTHEMVINHVKEAVDLNELTSFCVRLSDSLEELVGYYHGTKDYAYLLHCWVGINSADTLKKKSSYIQELISIKFKENAYYYIDSIAISLMEIILYLPENFIEKILISFQRVSDFSKGIDLLNELRKSDAHSYNKFRIYYVKFLIQTYEFEDALDELKHIPNSSLKLLCQTNALQHLGLDDQVEHILNTEVPLCNQDENYYIILRNTAHYFIYEKAEANLLAALDHFSRNKYTSFVIATIHNNLSVINIWKGDYQKANQYLLSAINTLQNIQSNEIFEPYCNMSILHLLESNYNEAYSFAQKALENCPRSLSMDIIMLNINRVIIELCQQTISLEEAFSTLESLAEQYPIIDDPWYEFQLLYNKQQLAVCLQRSEEPLKQIHKRYITEYNNGKTKYYLIKQLHVANMSVEFCLGLSPNWRY